MMRDFTLTLDSFRVADELRRLLVGQGAFRRFKNALDRAGLVDAWDQYRTERYRDVVIAWCEEHALAYVEGC